MQKLTIFSIATTAFQLLNKPNRHNILEDLNHVGDEDEFLLALKNLEDTELKDLETSIIQQYRKMDKNRIYIFNEVITGDNIETLKKKYFKARRMLFQTCELENTSWFIEDCSDGIHAYFYKLKDGVRRPKEGELEWSHELKLLIFELVITCYDQKIWAILKFPTIVIKPNDTYGFIDEWSEVNRWLQNKFGCSIKVFDLKAFYEDFSDAIDLVKMAWDVSNFKDNESNVRDTNFKIKITQGETVELAKIYNTLDSHLNPDFQEYLKELYSEYCKTNDLSVNNDVVAFINLQNHLMPTEMIFKGIQKKCENLIGSISHIERLKNQEIKEIVRFTIEKSSAGIAGILRSSKEGYEHYDKLFPEIRDYFDPPQSA